MQSNNSTGRLDLTKDSTAAAFHTLMTKDPRQKSVDELTFAKFDGNYPSTWPAFAKLPVDALISGSRFFSDENVGAMFGSKIGEIYCVVGVLDGSPEAVATRVFGTTGAVPGSGIGQEKRRTNTEWFWTGTIESNGKRFGLAVRTKQLQTLPGSCIFDMTLSWSDKAAMGRQTQGSPGTP